MLIPGGEKKPHWFSWWSPSYLLERLAVHSSGKVVAKLSVSAKRSETNAWSTAFPQEKISEKKASGNWISCTKPSELIFALFCGAFPVVRFVRGQVRSRKRFEMRCWFRFPNSGRTRPLPRHNRWSSPGRRLWSKRASRYIPPPSVHLRSLRIRWSVAWWLFSAVVNWINRSWC